MVLDYLKATKCAMCGEDFYIPSKKDWKWRSIKARFYCSYNCMMKRLHQLEEMEQNGEISNLNGWRYTTKDGRRIYE